VKVRIENLLRRSQLFLAVAAVVAVIWYLAWLNHNDFERAMVRQAQNQLTIIARSEAQSIEKYIGDIDDELSGVSSDPRLLSAIAEKGARNTALLGDLYKNIAKVTDSLYLIDARGHLLDVMPFKGSSIGTDLSKMPDINTMLSERRAFTSGLFEGVSGNKEISNLHPVFDDGKFIGILRAVISVDRINKLIEHINGEQNVYAVVIDDDANILSSSNKENIGKNALALLGENPPRPEIRKMEEIIKGMNGGRSGIAAIRYLPGQTGRKSAEMLVSFTPIRIGSEIWSIAVAMDYSAIIGPINRNARDNLAFVAFILLVLMIAGAVFYRSEKKNTELSVSKTCLDLINKQLHLEIEKRKEIEKRLTESIRNRR